MTRRVAQSAALPRSRIRSTDIPEPASQLRASARFVWLCQFRDGRHGSVAPRQCIAVQFKIRRSRSIRAPFPRTRSLDGAASHVCRLSTTVPRGLGDLVTYPRQYPGSRNSDFEERVRPYGFSCIKARGKQRCSLTVSEHFYDDEIDRRCWFHTNPSCSCSAVKMPEKRGLRTGGKSCARSSERPL
jgi:hypothetical protein